MKQILKKRSYGAIGALAISATVLVSSVAAAASLSAAFLWLTSSISAKSGALVKWRDVVSVLSLATLSSSIKQSWTTVQTPSVTTPSTKPVDSGSAAAGMPATKLGINLSGPAYWEPNRVFANLASGGMWTLINPQGQWLDMPVDRMNANLDVVDLRAGEKIARMISRPNQIYRGITADIVCSWQGTGKVALNGLPVKNIRISGKSLTFNYMPMLNNGVYFIIEEPSPTDPIRGLDCRETDVAQNLLYDKNYVSEIKRYSVLRFMKWNSSVENNDVATWAKRTKPGQGVFLGPQGIALEYMIDLANEAGTDAWFAIPWNSDEEYIRKFAETVRDRLNPARKAYVELSNEVWNYQFKVTHQAAEEGVAAGLSTNSHEAMLRRYAEKTGQVMDIWSSVFAGQMNRTVRVASTQTGAWNAETILGFRDTAKKVDALASAPYFNDTLAAGTITTSASLDQYFRTFGATIAGRIQNAKTTKAVAVRYGLRYVAYEAGQHIISQDDVPQLLRIQKDPRMGNLYTAYLTAWKDEVGDLMMLFSDYGMPTKYGAWGQKDYVGQPLSEAPKENAVELFRQSYVR